MIENEIVKGLLIGIIIGLVVGLLTGLVLTSFGSIYYPYDECTRIVQNSTNGLNGFVCDRLYTQ